MPYDDYDDDDLIDYANDADQYYDEEELAADIADVREMVGSDSKDLTDDDIKQALERADYDLDKTAKTLKIKLAKANKPKSMYIREQVLPDCVLTKNDGAEDRAVDKEKPAPKLSKLAALAQARAKQKEQGQEKSTESKDLGLSQLKREQSNGSTTSIKSTTSLKSIDLLNKIKKTKNSSNSTISTPSVAKSAEDDIPRGSALSKLAALRNRTESKVTSSENSIISRLGKPQFPEKPKPKPSAKPTKPKRRVKLFPFIDFGRKDPIDREVPSSELGRIFDSGRAVAKGIANSIYLPVDQQKVKQAFSTSSPDDIILKAQERGFGKPQSKETTPAPDDNTEELSRQLKKTTIASVAPLPDLSSIKNSRKLDVAVEESKKSTKPNISFVVIGHVDAGKSTLMGRLLYDSGDINEHTLNKYKKDSASAGKSSFAFAWAFDQTEEERKRGVTIDICVQNFDTKAAHFTVVDAPGHRDFVPNMIAGSAQADNAVLVVDSAVNAFEAGFHLDGQTKEHAILVRSLGVDNIIVAVNKLDTVNWAQNRYEQIRDELTEYLISKVGFSKKSISFIPTSGLNGENVVKKPTETKLIEWYTGRTLLEQLENNPGTGSNVEGNLRLIAGDAYSGDYLGGVVVKGKIDSGSAQVGETVVVMPAGRPSRIKSILFEAKQTGKDETRPYAVAGENVGLVLADLSLEEVAVGDVVCNLEAPVQGVNKFKSRIIIFDLKRPILVGSKMNLHRGRTNIPCKITKILASIEKSTGEIIKNKPRHLISGQAAEIEITLEEGKIIPLERFKDNKSLGRFVLRNTGITLAAGVVDDFGEDEAYVL